MTTPFPRVCNQVLGFGVDPALRINVFDELTLGEGFDGVTQVQGFHSESRAFHFQGTVCTRRRPNIRFSPDRWDSETVSDSP